MKNAPLFGLLAAAMISCSGGSGSDSPAPQDQQAEVKCSNDTEWQKPATKAGDNQSQKVAKFIDANLAKVKATDLKTLSRTYETCLKSVLED